MPHRGAPLFFRISFLILAVAAISAAGYSRSSSGRGLASEVSKLREGYVYLPNHTVNLYGGTDLGPMPSGQSLSLTLSLALSDRAGAEAFVQSVSAPGSPARGQYLKPAEFYRRFGPNESDVTTVLAYLEESGVSANRSLPTTIHVEGSVAQIQAAFGVSLHQFHTLDGRTVYAPQGDPSVPAVIAPKITAVSGLSDLGRPTKRRAPTALHPLSTSPSESSPWPLYLNPSSIGSVYDFSPITLQGEGQTIALAEFSGYAAADVAQFAQSYGLNAPDLTNILIDGATGATDSESIEPTLDIELALAMAPRAKYLVYEAPELESGFIDLFARIADDDLASTVSISWAHPEILLAQSDLQAEYQAFLQMAAQGQAVFAAAGDMGASFSTPPQLTVWDPASQPYVTAVGGTSLTIAPVGVYHSESSWLNGDEGGGGGISQVWPLPSWQAGLGNSGNLGSGTNRMVPDISLAADAFTSFYDFYYQGEADIAGGTSAGTPIWAAFSALVNEGREALGKPAIGFFSPALYAVAQSTAYGQAFHDVADGSTNGFYPAVAGYDLSTGWGSPVGAQLYALLVDEPASANSALGTLAVVNSATYGAGVAAGSIASIFQTSGAGMLHGLASPVYTFPASASDSLQIQLVQGSRVALASVLYASDTQINVVLPDSSVLGPGGAQFNVILNGAITTTGMITLADLAPGIFTQGATGSGFPLALLYNAPGSGVPLGDQAIPDDGSSIIVLYGTGLRGSGGEPIRATATLTAGAASVWADVLYAGAAPGYAGEDQVNIQIPNNPALRGQVAGLALSVNGIAANPITLQVAQ